MAEIARVERATLAIREANVCCDRPRCAPKRFVILVFAEDDPGSFNDGVERSARPRPGRYISNVMSPGTRT